MRQPARLAPSWPPTPIRFPLPHSPEPRRQVRSRRRSACWPPPKSPRRRPCPKVRRRSRFPSWPVPPEACIVGLAISHAPTKPILRRWWQAIAPWVASQAPAGPRKGCWGGWNWRVPLAAEPRWPVGSCAIAARHEMGQQGHHPRVVLQLAPRRPACGGA